MTVGSVISITDGYKMVDAELLSYYHALIGIPSRVAAPRMEKKGSFGMAMKLPGGFRFLCDMQYVSNTHRPPLKNGITNHLSGMSSRAFADPSAVKVLGYFLRSGSGVHLSTSEVHRAGLYRQKGVPPPCKIRYRGR